MEVYDLFTFVSMQPFKKKRLEIRKWASWVMLNLESVKK